MDINRPCTFILKRTPYVSASDAVLGLKIHSKVIIIFSLIRIEKSFILLPQ